MVSVEAVADRRAGSPLAAAVRQFLRSAVSLRSVVSANGFEEAEAWEVVPKRGSTGTRTGTGTKAGFKGRREVIEKKVRKCMRAGVRPGLQILWSRFYRDGRFDSDSLPPGLHSVGLRQ